MSDNDKTAIWYRDAVAAFDRNNLHKFIPLRTMALTQQLNAVFRLSLYYSVIMVLLTRSPKHFTVALVVAVLTAAIYELSTNERFTAVVAEEEGLKSRCTLPTKSNPYMNVSLIDLEVDRDRPPACDVLSPAVKDAIEKSERVPHTDDPHMWGRSQIRFNTMPSTTIPNDQAGFAQWLYGGRQSNVPGARA